MTSKTPRSVALPEGLAADQLRIECDPADIGFETTTDLGPDIGTDSGLIGQDRAIDAIALSAGIGHRDFNIYVLGETGSGRHRAVSALLTQQAKKRETPGDWVYVNNFEAPHKPNAIQLPVGQALALRSAMQNLVDDLAHEIPDMFESEEYQTQRRTIEQEFGERHEAPMAEFAEAAQREDVALLRTPMGYILAAVVDGKPITPDKYEALPKEERDKVDEKIERLQDKLADVFRLGPQLEKEHRQRLEVLHASMAERVVSLRVAEVTAQFEKVEPVHDYLEAVRQDMISNAEIFLLDRDHAGNGPFPEAIRKFHREPQFDRYAVNVMVSHSDNGTSGAPVVTEPLPTLSQLTGRIEHQSQMGMLVTNFTLIKPGALHKANGGFLILDARRLLSEPYAWDALKRCLQGAEVTITSMADRLSLTSTISLEPEPIPLNVRVVLIGDRWLHTMLEMLDPEFAGLFKLQADFENDLPRSKTHARQYARVIAAHARRSDLLPLTSQAVAALLDQAVRLAEDSRKFTLNIGALSDIMCEADQYARQAGNKTVAQKDVARAIDEADRRASRIKDRLHEATVRNTLLIDTSGTAVGQINGLSVLGIGRHSFGRPSRITARVRMGAGKVVDIEREVELGGPLHSKGVLILGGYLSSTYALDVPMSLHASLVFEQSYGGVDGDSASSAELYALLSALSDVPLRQGLAVTGSVNQAGQVQAIGGVNEKIEGFFDICKARRLTGTQGVLIPQANVEHLMLRPDVVAAAAKGQFRIIPIKTIDQGIEVLTGRQAGKRGRSGAFPDGSVNALVEARLQGYAEARRKFSDTGDTAEKGKK
jgi:lon-related putative ATP-dependent protease